MIILKISKNHSMVKLMRKNYSFKKIYLICSGKGGVGKSTTTYNLALNLAAQGLKAAIFDADVYNSSIPLMMNINHRHLETANPEILIPPSKHGVKVMSAGFMIPDNMPVIWRGQTLFGMLNRMIEDTYWGDNDILLIDLPPGTGEIPVYISQLLPIDGCIIITTPDELAFQGSFKAANLFDSLDIPVYGIIENMTDEYYTVFGKTRQKELVDYFGNAFWGSVPLLPDINSGGTQHFTKITENLLEPTLV